LRGARPSIGRRTESVTTRNAIFVPQTVWIGTDVDPTRPCRLSGSKVLEVRDGVFDTPHRAKISWNLERCGG